MLNLEKKIKFGKNLEKSLIRLKIHKGHILYKEAFYSFELSNLETLERKIGLFGAFKI